MKLPVVRKLHFSPLGIASTILIIILAIFFGRVAIWEHNYIKAKEGSERAVAAVYEGENVEETPPTSTDLANYTVAPDKPRYLSIPSLGISNSRVVEIAKKDNGTLDTPANIHDVGWYVDSALPGSQDGTAIIDAHGGALGDGIFKSLPNVQTGAVIHIEMGDGRRFTYHVVDTASKSIRGTEANDYMSTASTSPEKGRGSLTLITCTGDWWLSSQTYSHRLFVRAVLE